MIISQFLMSHSFFTERKISYLFSFEMFFPSSSSSWKKLIIVEWREGNIYFSCHDAVDTCVDHTTCQSNHPSCFSVSSLFLSLFFAPMWWGVGEREKKLRGDGCGYFSLSGMCRVKESEILPLISFPHDDFWWRTSCWFLTDSFEWWGSGVIIITVSDVLMMICRIFFLFFSRITLNDPMRIRPVVLFFFFSSQPPFLLNLETRRLFSVSLHKKEEEKNERHDDQRYILPKD